MKPSEVIDKALTEIIPDESRWCQTLLETDDGKHCMAGAMMVAAHDRLEYPATFALEDDPYYVARQACMDVIAEVDSPHSIPSFNDSNSYDAVRAVMEKARAGLQEKGL